MQQEMVEVTTGAPQTDEGMVQCVDEVKDRQSDRNDKENVEESQDTGQTAVTSGAENQNTAAGCSNVENGEKLMLEDDKTKDPNQWSYSL